MVKSNPNGNSYQKLQYLSNQLKKHKSQKKKFKTVLNKSTGEKKEVPANITKHLFGSKSLYQYVIVAYDFETMLAKLDEAE